jgi:hypothetical protein
MSTALRHCRRFARAGRTASAAARPLLCMIGVAMLFGCGAKAEGPPPVTTESRATIKQNLTQLGAKITADVPEGLYASLRNTHVQILQSGGVVEGMRRTLRDVQDLGLVNEAVAKGFLDSGEITAFQQWLRQALSTADTGASRSEYGRYQLSLSRSPLRVVFSQRAPAND